MPTIISNIADILSIISAVVTVITAIAIRSYSIKIVRQYSFEKLTLAEQEMKTAKETFQKVKRMLSVNERGTNHSKLKNLYLDLEAILDSIINRIPTTFAELEESINSAKAYINQCMTDENISEKSDAFFELEGALNNVLHGLKLEKEKLQKKNMK